MKNMKKISGMKIKRKMQMDIIDKQSQYRYTENGENNHKQTPKRRKQNA